MQPPRRLRRVVPLIALLAGCGGVQEEIGLAPVSGVVRLDGQPLPGASVQFKPQMHDTLAPSSYGQTDDEGRYTLELASTGDLGAVPAEHVVSINLPIDDQLVNGVSVPGEGQLPARYNRSTTLRMTVPAEGRQDADFDLESE